MRRLFVIALVKACDAHDWLRIDHLTHEHRLADWSLALDTRWDTGVWGGPI